MSVASTRVLRFYVEARTAHLERARADDVDLAYMRRSYDFDDDLARTLGCHQVSWRGAYRLVRGGGYRVIEVNEPLMLGAWPLLLYVVTLCGLPLGRETFRPMLVAYAIENGDVVAWVADKLRVSRNVATLITRWLAGYVMRRLDRVAFGTSAAADRYESIPLISAQMRTFEALEPPCRCLGSANTAERSGLVFLGSFEKRKGVPQLMRAWELLARDNAHSLTLIGMGSLEADIRRWAGANVEIIVDPPREEIHERLGHAAVVVLLSQPAARWQEQVGLPIVEALSHGCEIVATSETGLAEWLVSHGHRVLDPGEGPADIARRLTEALDASRPPQSILADLPRQSQRAQAGRWLTAMARGGR